LVPSPLYNAPDKFKDVTEREPVAAEFSVTVEPNKVENPRDPVVAVLSVTVEPRSVEKPNEPDVILFTVMVEPDNVEVTTATFLVVTFRFAKKAIFYGRVRKSKEN
jgi:hypothetical protein